MNNYLQLLKVFFFSGFNVNRQRKNQRSSFGLFFLALGIFAFVSFSISFSFIMQAKEEGSPLETVLITILIMGLFISFVLSLYQLQSILFNTKDYEFLESLPVKKATIVGAKLSAIYFINLAEDLALILPAIIVYLLAGGSQIGSALVAFLSGFFISVVPILFSAIIGSISALISSKSKHSNLINIIVSLIFFVGIFGGYLYILYGGAGNLNAVIKYIFFLDWMAKGVFGDYLYTLYFVLFNIGASILVTVLISLIYSPVNSWMNTTNTHVDYSKIKKSEVMDYDLNRVLLKKEWNMISRRPQYLINSILGTFLFLVMSIIFLLIPEMFVSGEEDMPESMPYVFACIVPCMGILMNSVATSASASISFEGRYGYDMLRAYPLDPKDVIKAKLKIAIYLEAILNLVISSIVLVILIIKGFYAPHFIIAVYLYPQFAGLLFAIIGMLAGLRWPKLDYENEAQVLKNSAASNLLILFVMLPSFLVFGLHLVFAILGYDYPIFSYIGLGSVSLIYIILIPIFGHLLKKKGPNLFLNIINKN